MQQFFKVAILITIALTFMNGMMFSFQGDLTDEKLIYKDVSVTNEDVQDLRTVDDGRVVEGDALSKIVSFVSNLIGTVTNVGGGIGKTLDMLFTFSQGYATALQNVFGGIPPIWTFLSLTVIPMLNALQIISITYLLIYAVSALRGGGAG
jgi:hypothetical protein